MFEMAHISYIWSEHYLCDFQVFAKSYIQFSPFEASNHNTKGATGFLLSKTYFLRFSCYKMTWILNAAAHSFKVQHVPSPQGRQTEAWVGEIWETTLPTVMGHPNWKALVETTVLALIPILFLNLATTVTFVIHQLQPNRSPKDTLWMNIQFVKD